METSDILGYLNEHPFFEGLSDGYMETLADCAAVKSYAAGEMVFEQDADASFFYIVFKGEIDVEIPAIYGPPVELDLIKESAILGWSWLIPPYKWHFDASALSDSILICFDGRCIRTKCEEDHSFGYDLLKRFSKMMGDRLQAARLHAMRRDAY